MFECSGERERIANAAKVFEESLNSDGGEMLNYRDEEAGGAILVLDEGLSDAGLVRKIPGSIGKD